MPGDAMGCVPGQNCVYVCLAPDEQQEPIFSLARQLVAEAVGSALLVATIVGSGLQAVQLSTDDGVALLGNTVATLGILYVLITVFGKVSGAHFNPLVVSPSSLATQRASPARTPVSPTPRISARSANHCARAPCRSVRATVEPGVLPSPRDGAFGLRRVRGGAVPSWAASRAASSATACSSRPPSPSMAKTARSR